MAEAPIGSAAPPSGRGRYGNPSPLPQEFTNSKCGRGGKRFPLPRSNSLLSWLPDCRFSPLPQRVPPARPSKLLPPSPKLPHAPIVEGGRMWSLNVGQREVGTVSTSWFSPGFSHALGRVFRGTCLAPGPRGWKDLQGERTPPPPQKKT